MSDDGIMKGCLFPGGYRLYGLKVKSHLLEGVFFMECRNFKKNDRRVLSAMVKKKS